MKHLLLAAALFGCLTSAAETPWKPAGDRIKTRWAAEVDPAAPLPEYPRPTLVRSRWRNLNGLWNYSLTPAGAAAPGEAQGRILVPFPIESSLSGVQRGVTPQEDELWYEHARSSVPAAWRRGNDVLLHFGAVDWQADVYRQRHPRRHRHTGGYHALLARHHPLRLRPKAVQKLAVTRDRFGTDKGYQPRGKQALEPQRHLVHARQRVSGRPVWIEPVPAEPHLGYRRPCPTSTRRHSCRRNLVGRREDRPHGQRPASAVTLLGRWQDRWLRAKRACPGSPAAPRRRPSRDCGAPTTPYPLRPDRGRSCVTGRSDRPCRIRTPRMREIATGRDKPTVSTA